MKKFVLTFAMVLCAAPAFAVCEVQTASGSYANYNTLVQDVCGTTGGRKVEMSTLLSGEDQTNGVLRTENQWEWETVAASQTDQVMGTTGAIGDLLHAVICNMSAASVGAVSIKDGAGSAIVIYGAQAGAADPPVKTLDMVSVAGAWKITTGTNTTCIGLGRFN